MISAKDILSQGNTLVSSTNTYTQKVKSVSQISEIEHRGPRIMGYQPYLNADHGTGRLPSVYDGLLYDSNLYRVYDSTFYVAGMVACVALLITGVIIVSEK